MPFAVVRAIDDHRCPSGWSWPARIVADRAPRYETRTRASVASSAVAQVRVGDRDRRQERLRVRHDRPRVELGGGGELDELSEVEAVSAPERADEDEDEPLLLLVVNTGCPVDRRSEKCEFRQALT
jgi:hypothetical protein